MKTEIKRRSLWLALLLAALCFPLSALADDFDPLDIAPTPTPTATPSPTPPQLTQEQLAACLAPGVQDNRLAEVLRPMLPALIAQYNEVYKFLHDPSDGLTYAQKWNALAPESRTFVGYFGWQIYNMIIAVDSTAPVSPPAAPAPTPGGTPSSAKKKKSHS